jgi:phosphatidylserine decarboxylase
MPSAFRESLKIIVPLLIGWLVSLALPGAWAWMLGVPFFFLILFSLYFFRDPERVVPTDPRAIVSAADGTVVAVDEVENAPLGQGRMLRISIFLSVFNVHVNRVPVAGEIKTVLHTPGKFHDARLPEASLQNERQDWLIEASEGSVVVRQIAGLIARRIIGWEPEGEALQKGARIGMIRFGSRTEIYLPVVCEVAVKPGDQVQGGSSIIARWPEFKMKVDS